MRVLFDTNVVLDVLLNLEPHAQASARAIALVERGKVQGFLCATAVTTLFYLTSRVVGPRRAREQIATLLRLFEVAPVDRLVLTEALDAGFADYEDGVLHETARHAGMHCIVTRNVGDFAAAKLMVWEPAEFLRSWRVEPGQP
ncbi:MAG: PIN domain-containing protein [Burkholderiaceae bacterium]